MIDVMTDGAMVVCDNCGERYRLIKGDSAEFARAGFHFQYKGDDIYQLHCDPCHKEIMDELRGRQEYAFPKDTASGKMGMTLRDYFAAKAMAAMIDRFKQWDRTNLANASYEAADAMLKERNRNAGPVESSVCESPGNVQ